MKEQTKDVIIKWTFFILLGINLILIIQFYLYPAYLSYRSNCYPQISQEGVAILGQFSVNTETGAYEITTIQNASMWVTNHELCHLKQYQEGHLHSCEENKFGVYLNELEAYLNFPC